MNWGITLFVLYLGLSIGVGCRNQGQCLALKIRAPETTFHEGAPLTIDFMMTNGCRGNVAVIDPSWDFGTTFCQITDDQGIPVSPSILDKRAVSLSSTDYSSHVVVIKPGEELKRRLTPNFRRGEMGWALPVGTYGISCRYSMGPGAPEFSGPMRNSLWTGDVTSNRIAVEVKQPKK